MSGRVCVYTESLFFISPPPPLCFSLLLSLPLSLSLSSFVYLPYDHHLSRIMPPSAASQLLVCLTPSTHMLHVYLVSDALDLSHDRAALHGLLTALYPHVTLDTLLRDVVTASGMARRRRLVARTDNVGASAHAFYQAISPAAQLSSLPMCDQPTQLHTALFRYQRRCVAWMCARETACLTVSAAEMERTAKGKRAKERGMLCSLCFLCLLPIF